MKELEKATQHVIASSTEQEKMTALSKAFDLFSLETAKLKKAYETLGEQFQSLNLELQDSNHKLHNKVAELDIITDYLKNILENIVQGIIFIDLQGIILTFNHAAEAILGVKREEAIGNRFWEIFEDQIFGFSLQEILQKKQKPHPSHTTYHQSELEIITTLTLQPYKLLDPLHPVGSLHQGIILMIRDVTEMRHLQTMANRADRLKELGEMAAQVAHEIRNPLGGIKGFASLLKRDLTNQPEQAKMATHIIEGTDHLSHLVNQILHYARPISPHFENIDFIKWAKQIYEHILADGTIDHALISIQMSLPEIPIFLALDSTLFKSAILNLVVNAIQAMPNGGVVTINIKKSSGFVWLSVKDTGIGISKEDLTHLYSPFFTTKPEGNGFGLVEVQKVIQAHHGTIDVISELGKGTTFSIKLPIKVL